jgi:hypothetical protein
MRSSPCCCPCPSTLPTWPRCVACLAAQHSTAQHSTAQLAAQALQQAAVRAALQIPCGATVVLTGVQVQGILGCSPSLSSATQPGATLQALPSLCCAPASPPPLSPPPLPPSPGQQALDYCEPSEVLGYSQHRLLAWHTMPVVATHPPSCAHSALPMVPWPADARPLGYTYPLQPPPSPPSMLPPPPGQVCMLALLPCKHGPVAVTGGWLTWPTALCCRSMGCLVHLASCGPRQAGCWTTAMQVQLLSSVMHAPILA